MGARRPQLVQRLYRLLGADATHMSLVLDDKESHMWGAPTSLYSQTPLSVGSYGNHYTRPNVDRFVDGERWGAAIVRAYGGSEPDWSVVVMQGGGADMGCAFRALTPFRVPPRGSQVAPR